MIGDDICKGLACSKYLLNGGFYCNFNKITALGFLSVKCYCETHSFSKFEIFSCSLN